MSDPMSQSLDDIIKAKGRGGRRGGSGGFRGGSSRGGSRGGFRSGSSRGGRGGSRGGRGALSAGARFRRQRNNAMDVEPHPKGNPEDNWEHDLYENQSTKSQMNISTDGGGFRSRGNNLVISTGAKLSVSNLSYNIQDFELKDVFHRFGFEVKGVQIFYDKTDRSTGEAEIVLSTQEQAERAVRELNGAIVNEQKISVRLASGGNFRGGRKERGDSDNSDGIRIQAASGGRSVRIDGGIRKRESSGGRGGGRGGFRRGGGRGSRFNRN